VKPLGSPPGRSFIEKNPWEFIGWLETCRVERAQVTFSCAAPSLTGVVGELI
jgi:hypothetical protein